MSYVIVPAKRCYSDVDDSASVPLPKPFCPTHPYTMLEYLVEEVLPRKCSNPETKRYYQSQLDDPKATIDECKSLLAGWVVELWEKKELRSVAHLQEKFTTQYPCHGVVYTICLIVDNEPWFYAGQAKNAFSRIAGSHQKQTYRDRNPYFLYFLWARAQAVHFFLPVSNAQSVSGPVLNVLEQWVALIFLALQPSEMKSNLSLAALRSIPSKDMQHGVNVREPLGQNVSFQDFPRAGESFVYSSEPVKRDYQEHKLRLKRQAVPRKQALLKGDLYPGSFWPLNRMGWIDYEFVIFHTRFLVGKADIDRLDEDTIRVHCDLLPEGQIHPHSVSRFLRFRPIYEDPAQKLGIKISGIRKADQQESFLWVERRGDADRWIPKLNRLVDWLESKNPFTLRPRRPYGPENLDLPPLFYTRHPLDSGDDWDKLVSFEVFQAASPQHQFRYNN